MGNTPSEAEKEACGFNELVPEGMGLRDEAELALGRFET